jgi:NitT/TauT family transport system permease protein
MQRIPSFRGIHAEPSQGLRWFLGAVPLVILVVLYLGVSHVRLANNPGDKLTPSVAGMARAVKMMAFTQDSRTGGYLMLDDTISSLRRLFIGVGAAAVVGLFLGLNMGMLPGMGALGAPAVTFLSIVPPLAILPILFIIFGVGELGKVMLIFLGGVFTITRDVEYATRAIPREQTVKALTLGGSQLEVIYRVVLPQILPRLLVAVRLSLGTAWLFLIASEAIAASDGLGYRIFLVRRYLSMDIIIPYVLWITFLGFALDTALRFFVRWRYPWSEASD